MLGRTPGDILAIRPMSDGVIADYTTTQKMLEYLFNKVVGRKRLFKPRVLVCVPSQVTSVSAFLPSALAIQIDFGPVDVGPPGPRPNTRRFPSRVQSGCTSSSSLVRLEKIRTCPLPSGRTM